MNIDGIPVRIMILKADGTSQDASASPDSSGTSSKWLGFAKTLAWNCLQRSKKSHSWVSETKKLPSADSTTSGTATSESGKLSFVLVKCHADQRLCLVIIRTVSSQGIHGIILTPCSSLSPDGWGKPVTEANTPWGTPGVAENHNLDLTTYSGEQNGVGTQGVLTYEEWTAVKDDPPYFHPRFKHGAEWFPFVNTKAAASAKEDYAVGGFLAVTPTKDIAEPDDTGFEKITTGGSVYSVGARWLPAFRNYWDVNPDSTVSVIEEEVFDQYGHPDYYYGDKINHHAATSLFKDGKSSSVSGALGHVLGVGFRKATVDSKPVDKMLLVTASGSNYIVYAAAAPYKSATQLLAIPGSYTEQDASQDPDKNFYLPGFFFDQSGTKASAIVYGWKEKIGRDGVPHRSLEPDLYRLTFSEDASEVALEVTPCAGCEEDNSVEYNEYMNERGFIVQDSYYYSASASRGLIPIAVGFHRDVEKILYIETSFTQGTRQIYWYAAGGAYHTELGPEFRNSVKYYVNDTQLASLQYYDSTLTVRDRLNPAQVWVTTTVPAISGESLLKLFAVDFINDVLYYSRTLGAGATVGSAEVMANDTVLSVIPGVST